LRTAGDYGCPKAIASIGSNHYRINPTAACLVMMSRFIVPNARTASVLLAWWWIVVSIRRDNTKSDDQHRQAQEYEGNKEDQQRRGRRGLLRRQPLFSNDNGELVVGSYHKTVGIGGPVAQIVRLTNGRDRPDDATQDVDFRTGLRQLRETLAAFAVASIRIRA
jgi:hypothetical protein